MKKSFSSLRVVAIVAVVVAIAGVVAWRQGIFQPLGLYRPANSLNRMEDPPMEGWLCPALFRYYREAPKELYVKAEPKP